MSKHRPRNLAASVRNRLMELARKTALPAEPPLALMPEFGADDAKIKQWAAFLKRGKLDADGANLEQVCAFLNGFLMPPTQALAAGEEWTKDWSPGGPWGAKELQ